MESEKIDPTKKAQNKLMLFLFMAPQ